jgi:hypothetical protein
LCRGKTVVKRVKKQPKPKSPKPYEAFRHLIGIADSGGQRLSENTGEKFLELRVKRELREGYNVYRHH